MNRQVPFFDKFVRKKSRFSLVFVQIRIFLFQNENGEVSCIHDEQNTSKKKRGMLFKSTKIVQMQNDLPEGHILKSRIC